jgi:hypothetical protein
MRLLGRDDDLVKVAGKRASLAGLGATLRSIEGVVDGAFFLPADGALRVCAVAVAPSMTQADLQRALAARVDPAFMPRPLLLVESIPRGAAFKVPVARLRELVASRGAIPVATVEASIALAACFDSTDPVFPGHFPGGPVVPGVLLVECVEAALRARGLRLVEVRSCKFHAVAKPDEMLDVRIECPDRLSARFEIRRGATLVAGGTCALVEALS